MSPGKGKGPKKFAPSIIPASSQASPIVKLDELNLSLLGSTISEVRAKLDLVLTIHQRFAAEKGIAPADIVNFSGTNEDETF